MTMFARAYETDGRWLQRGGLAAMLGGVTFPVWLAVEDVFSPGYVIGPGELSPVETSLGWMLSTVLLVVGLVVFHSWAREGYGLLGLVGAMFTGLGLASLLGAQTAIATGIADPYGPLVAILGLAGFLSVATGMTVVGAALYLTRTSWRILAWLFLATGLALSAEVVLVRVVLDLPGHMLSPYVFGVQFALAWLIAGRQLRFVAARNGATASRRDGV